MCSLLLLSISFFSVVYIRVLFCSFSISYLFLRFGHLLTQKHSHEQTQTKHLTVFVYVLLIPQVCLCPLFMYYLWTCVKPCLCKRSQTSRQAALSHRIIFQLVFFSFYLSFLRRGRFVRRTNAKERQELT